MTSVNSLLCIMFMVNLLTFIDAFGMNLIKVPEDDRSQVVCTIALLKKYFHSGESLSGSVLSMSITSASVHIQQSLLNAIHTESNFPWTVVIKNARQDIPATSPVLILHEKPQCYFVVVENLEDDDLEDIFEDWKTTVNWNPLAQFIVYLASVEETDEEMTELMVEILLSFMNKKIYNVNVIGQNEENSYYYGKTVFPYHPDNNCGNRVIAIETLDICDYQEDDTPQDSSDYEEEFEVEDGGDEGADTIVNEAENDTKEKNLSVSENSRENEISSNHDYEINENIYYNGINNEMQTVVDGDKYVEDTFEKNQICANYSLEKELSTESDVPQQYRGMHGTTEKYVTDSTDNPSLQSSNKSEGPKFYLQELYRALFLDKFPKDLSGCPLMAAYRPWEPYIFNDMWKVEKDYGETVVYDDSVDSSTESDLSFEENTYVDVNTDQIDSDSETRLSGIEYEMVQTIGERLHINIDLQVESTNLYHLFQQLIDGDIEMVVGGIDEDPSISQFVSSTIPYHQDDLTWCVAKAKPKLNLLNVLSSFHWSTWVLTLIFIIATSLNILLTQMLLKVRIVHFRGYSTIVLRMLGIVLSQSTQLVRIPTTLKLSLGSAFFMGFMFINTYQSFLVSTLTTPKSSYQISHLNELYQHRMIVTGSVENVRHLNKEGEVFKYIREKFQMCYNIEECLSRAASNEYIAVAVSRQHSFYNPRIPRDRLYCFNRDENLYVYLVTMLLPKKFHLLHKINPVIQHIIESGHMQKWARDLDLKRKIQEEISRAREEPVKSLTLNQIGGSFVLHTAFSAFAFLVLLIERWVFGMVVKKRTRCKLIKMLHKKFRN